MKLLIYASAWALPAIYLMAAPSAQAANFTTETASAVKFGVHEIVLSSAGDAANPNPFDTVVKVNFIPPSGEKNAKIITAFYDGGNTWRARVYVSEAGQWRWSSACETDKSLNAKSGTFKAADSQLRGRLLIHPKNPRQWITENGRWFLNLNDTAYFLLSTHDGHGQPIPFDDFTAYVRDAVAHGITSVRCFAQSGPKGFKGDGDSYRWRDMYADDAMTKFNLEQFQNTDRRMQWMLDAYPDLYVQFILFPLGTNWRTDETFWKSKMNAAQKERLMNYMIARYAAYPQIFWLIVNDAHYDKDHPNNNALAREAGEFFMKHDPWRHPLSTGHARKVPFYFGKEEWATYAHLEDAYDLGAKAYESYHSLAKPVFLGEDRYEQDHAANVDPEDMRYYQRRLFWSWLFAGGSTNYGGRWWVVHPYSQTGKCATPPPWKGAAPFTAQLTGLDSVAPIRRYLEERRIELSDFEPAHDLARDPDERKEGQTLKVMRRAADEFLIYHPNAASSGKTARVDAGQTARFRLDLQDAAGSFRVEWYRAEDGAAKAGAEINGGREVELTAPWKGCDVVAHLRKK
ncbi:MAG: DUF4038 domain-containing protein [Candidatus Sumerlaeota bacterium]|nr:DUF4038 domain-containing protein [Candidatus Sumerlaeota bacterium]